MRWQTEMRERGGNLFPLISIMHLINAIMNGFGKVVSRELGKENISPERQLESTMDKSWTKKNEGHRKMGLYLCCIHLSKSKAKRDFIKIKVRYFIVETQSS